MRISDWSSDVCSSDLVERDLFGDLPAALAVGLEHVLAAVGSRASRQLHLVVGVGDVAGALLRVAFDQGAFAADKVDAVPVVPLAVAVVHAHQHAVRVPVAAAGHDGPPLSVGLTSTALPTG